MMGDIQVFGRGAVGMRMKVSMQKHAKFAWAGGGGNGMRENRQACRCGILKEY
jgi:hypothetical protein